MDIFRTLVSGSLSVTAMLNFSCKANTSIHCLREDDTAKRQTWAEKLKLLVTSERGDQQFHEQCTDNSAQLYTLYYMYKCYTTVFVFTGTSFHLKHTMTSVYCQSSRFESTNLYCAHDCTVIPQYWGLNVLMLK